MSMSNAFETALLQHILENSDLANVGDATGLRGSTTAGVLYISLHTADPGEAGTQASNEVAYTGYARVSVVRSAAGWTVTNGVGTNDAAITFPQCTGGTSTATHFGIGSAVSGAGNLFISGALAASLAISNNVTPEFAAGQLSVTAD